MTPNVYLITCCEQLTVRSAVDRSPVVLKEGTEHLLVEVANPTGGEIPWLVIDGTQNGAAKTWWEEQCRRGFVDCDELDTA